MHLIIVGTDFGNIFINTKKMLVFIRKSVNIVFVYSRTGVLNLLVLAYPQIVILLLCVPP